MSDADFDTAHPPVDVLARAYEEREARREVRGILEAMIAWFEGMGDVTAKPPFVLHAEHLIGRRMPIVDEAQDVNQEPTNFATGMSPVPPGQEHMDVLTRAFNLFMDRNEKRQDLWRQAGWKGNLIEMRKKLDRLWRAWDEVGEKDFDEALDLINATVFWYLCAVDMNKDGHWPWPN
jgi:hypothetical protein